MPYECPYCAEAQGGIGVLNKHKKECTKRPGAEVSAETAAPSSEAFEATGEGRAAPFIPATMVPAINVFSVGKIVYLRVEARVVKGGVVVEGAELMR